MAVLNHCCFPSKSEVCLCKKIGRLFLIIRIKTLILDKVSAFYLAYF